MVFFELRWNYSPLKEKAVLLPDGLFILLVASRQTAKESCLRENYFAPDASRSARKSASRLAMMVDKICRFAKMLQISYRRRTQSAPEASRSAARAS
jgi:hypothetical protein